ncbi:MAG: iron-containing alcohol dehydrogenase [Defluviitaleaceae bacterium]|nr:iron-containing alcohol dehydrogenase [Defluviitaleaceae bacterium]
MYKLYCRAYQNAFRAGAVALPWRRPKRLGGYNALGMLLQDRGCDSVLVVTDNGLIGLDLHQELLKVLAACNISAAIYSNTAQNPTVDNIEEALALYKENNCKAIIALGGGSPIDCAKGVGVRITCPNKSIPDMRGQLKILISPFAAKMPLLIAIPTTAGSGSEVSVAAVVRDKHVKYAINDPTLIPHYVLHDPHLTVNLPPSLTATTGMDALCHAVEAYIGKSNTCRTEMDAIKAVRIIFSNLYPAYQDGHNIKARANMQKAAYLAGAAFTRAYVGNIHAISHALSGQYGTPHGLANAVIMPYVLDAYGKAVEKPLSELAIAAGLGDQFTPKKEASRRFISAIKEMNAKMGIPNKIDELLPQDIPELAKHALKEANPLYPVPVIFGYNDVAAVLNKLL